MKPNYVNKLIKICLDIAELVDTKGDDDPEWFGGDFSKEIGLGYRALSGYLRSGAKAVIDIQRDYHTARERLNFAEREAEDCREYMEELFGDPEPQSINEEDKKRIKDFVASIMKEWDEQDED